MKSLSSHASAPAAFNGLLPLRDVVALIETGLPLAIAGRAEALDLLPPGNWIAGTTPYFMTAEGGRIVGADLLFVTSLPAATSVRVACYGADELERISADAPDSGFALAIIPAQSGCHERFALDAAGYPQAFLKPTIGWIAGVDLAEAGAVASVYDGSTATAHADRAVVLHVEVPGDAMLSVEIVNLFEADDGDVIRFDEDGFAPRHCIVDGERRCFADYVAGRGRADGALPLVGDFGGAPVNVSLKNVDAATGEVTLYAPVFSGVDYRFAAPLDDYAGSFRRRLEGQAHDGTLWSCNCILNFLFGELEGKAIGGVAGPVTFGEIAYQLLNQTLVSVRLR